MYEHPRGHRGLFLWGFRIIPERVFVSLFGKYGSRVLIQCLVLNKEVFNPLKNVGSTFWKIYKGLWENTLTYLLLKSLTTIRSGLKSWFLLKYFLIMTTVFKKFYACASATWIFDCSEPAPRTRSIFNIERNYVFRIFHRVL